MISLHRRQNVELEWLLGELSKVRLGSEKRSRYYRESISPPPPEEETHQVTPTDTDSQFGDEPLRVRDGKWFTVVEADNVMTGEGLSLDIKVNTKVTRLQFIYDRKTSKISILNSTEDHLQSGDTVLRLNDYDLKAYDFQETVKLFASIKSSLFTLTITRPPKRKTIKATQITFGIMRHIFITKYFAIWCAHHQARFLLSQTAYQIIALFLHAKKRLTLLKWFHRARQLTYILRRLFRLVLYRIRAEKLKALSLWCFYVRHTITSQISNDHHLYTSCYESSNTASLSLGLDSWFALCRCKARALTFVSLRERIALVLALRAWNSFIEHHRARMLRILITLEDTVHHWFLRESASAFTKWQKRVRHAQKIDLTAQKLLRHMLYSHNAHGFETWRSFTIYKKIRQDRCYNAIAYAYMKWSALRIAAAFRSWLHFLQHRNHTNHLLSRTCRHWLLLAKAEGFTTWHSQIQHDKKILAIAQRLIRHMLHSHTAHAFQSWIIFAEKQYFLHDCCKAIHRALMRWSSLRTAAGFRSWLRVLDEYKRTHHFLSRVCRHWSLLATAECFNTWLLNYKHDKRITVTAERLIRHMLHSHTAHAFQSWTLFIRKKSHLRDCCNAFDRAVLRWSSVRSAAGFRTWLSFTAARRDADLILSKVCRHWLHLMLAGGFETWLLRYKHEKRVEVTAERLIRHMLHSHTAHGFQSWIVFTQRKAHLHDCCNAFDRAVLRWSSVRSAAGFRTWLSFTAARRDADLVLSKVCRHWSQLMLAEGFETWLLRYKHEKRVEVTAERLIRHMLHSHTAHGFQSWIVFTQRKSHLNDCCNAFDRALLRWASVRLAAGFRTWLRYIDEQHRMDHILSRVCRHWLQLLVAEGFETWLVGSEHVSKIENTARRLLHHMLHSHTAQGFQTWIIFTQKKAHFSDCCSALYRALERWSSVRIAAGFRTWLGFVQSHKYTDHVLSKTCRHWLQLVVAEGFATWQSRIEDAQNIEATADRLIRHMLHSHTALGFQSWIIYTEKKAHLSNCCNAFDRAVMRWSSVRLAAAFKTWLGFSQSHKYTELVMSRVCKHWLLLASAEAFLSWQSRIDDAHRVEALAERLVRHMLHSHTALGFQSWVQFTQKKAYLSDCCSAFDRAIKRWSSVRIAAGFRTWLGFVQSHKYTDHVLSKTCRHWLQLVVAEGFATWQSRTEDAQIVEATADRLIRHMLHSHTALGFQSWIIYTEKKAHLSDCCNAFDRAILRWSSIRIAAAFETWRKFRESHQHAEHIISRACRHWSLLAVAEGFETWQARLLHAQKIEATAERLILHILHSHTALGFQSWIVFNKKKEHLNDCCGAFDRAVMRWSAIRIAAGFRTWLDFLEIQKNTVHILSRASRHWLQLVVAEGFATWQSKVQHAHKIEGTAQRLLRHMLHCHTALGFQSWINFAHKKGHLNDCCNAFDRALMRWSATKVAAGFKTWLAFVESQTNTLHILSRASGHWLQLATAEAFATWQSRVLHAHMIEKTSHRLLRHMLHSHTALGFQSWISFAHKKGHLNDCCSVFDRALLRWSSARLGTGFKSWRDFIEEHKNTEHVLSRVCRHWLQLVRAEAFETWQFWVKHVQKIEGTSQRLLRHMLHSHTALGFQSWVIFAQRSAHLNDCCDAFDRAVMRWSSVRLAAGYKTWLDFIESHKGIENVLSRVCRHWSQVVVAEGFATWESRVKHAHKIEVTAQRMLRHMLHSHTALGYQSWITFARKKGNLNDCCSAFGRAVKRWSSSTLAASMKSWRRFLEVHQHTEHVLSRACRHWLQLATAAAFGRWHSNVEQYDKIDAMCHRLLGHMFHYRLSTAFQSWISMIQRKSQLDECCRTFARAGRRWALSAVATSFSTWFTAVESQREIDHVLRRACRHWFQLAIAQAFMRWQRQDEHEKKIKVMTQRLIGHMLHVQTAAAFQGWLLFLKSKAQLSECFFTFARAARRWSACKLAAAFGKWRKLMDLQEHVELIMTRACGHWSQLKKASAFAVWSLRLKFSRKVDVMAHRMLRHIMYCQSALAFQTWIAFTEKQNGLDEFCQRCARAGKKWARSQLSIGFRTWQSKAKQHTRAVLLRACRHWQDTRIASAFESWKCHALQMKSLELIVMKKWQDHESLKKDAFMRWRLEIRLGKVRVQSLGYVFKRHNLSQAYHRWRLRCRAMHRIDAMVRSSCRRDIYFALSRWMQNIRFVRKVKTRRVSALRPFLYAWPLLKAWHLWLEVLRGGVQFTISAPIQRRLVNRPRNSPGKPSSSLDGLAILPRSSFDPPSSPESMDAAAPLSKDFDDDEWLLPPDKLGRRQSSSIGGLDDNETTSTSSPASSSSGRSSLKRVQAVLRGVNSRNKVRIVRVPHDLYSTSSPTNASSWKPPKNWLSFPGSGTL